VPGGLLAALWSRPDWQRSPLREALGDVYRRHGDELQLGPMQPSATRSSDLWGRWEEEIAAADGFERAEVRRYEWPATYSSLEYVELLLTHSDHIPGLGPLNGRWPWH
jgi:hypothetical protein